jgi:CRISPR-associated Cas5-like protein
MRFFTMHLSGSVASFAGVQYDAAPAVLPVPTRSMITGMLGGAMGWSYRDHALLQELQDELDLGFVVHEPGTVIWDFQTTDMMKPHMVGAMWTLDANASLGVFQRGGGGKERDTASRPLTCGIDITAIVGVERDPEPLLAALRRPVFPVTLGRRGMFPRFFRARAGHRNLRPLGGCCLGFFRVRAGSPTRYSACTRTPPVLPRTRGFTLDVRP